MAVTIFGHQQETKRQFPNQTIRRQTKMRERKYNGNSEKLRKKNMAAKMIHVSCLLLVEHHYIYNVQQRRKSHSMEDSVFKILYCLFIVNKMICIFQLKLPHEASIELKN